MKVMLWFYLPKKLLQLFTEIYYAHYIHLLFTTNGRRYRLTTVQT